MTSNNPLEKYTRPIQIYIRLPSDGRWNKDGIDFTINKEVPVRAMTMRDEILNKSPDALLNGNAVESLIKSCVPEIKNVRETPMPDVDALLLAIQYATYGDTMKYKTNCPKCKAEKEIVESRRTILGGTKPIPEINTVVMTENDGTELHIILKPYSYENSVLVSLSNFESQKRLALIKAMSENQNMKDATEEEKIKKQDEIEKSITDQMRAIFTSSADLAVALANEAVMQINIVDTKKPDGDPQKITVVSDKKFIEDFIRKMDPRGHDKIKSKMDEIMDFGVKKKTHLVCDDEKCKNEWDQEVGYDHQNFFVKDSAP